MVWRLMALLVQLHFQRLLKQLKKDLHQYWLLLKGKNGLILILGHDMSLLIYQISQRSCLRMAPLFLKQETLLGRL